MPKTKAKQPDLPGVTGEGVSPLSIPEIDKAAEKYIRERDKRKEISPKEKEAKDNLIDTIEKNLDKLVPDSEGTIIYTYEGEVVIYKPKKADVRVKTIQEVT